MHLHLQLLWVSLSFLKGSRKSSCMCTILKCIEGDLVFSFDMERQISGANFVDRFG